MDEYMSIPGLTDLLQEWYKKMLDKGIIERIVLDYKDIYKQALEDNIQSPAELPYFEGDFWPNVMEENIRELEQEEEARKRVRLYIVRVQHSFLFYSRNYKKQRRQSALLNKKLRMMNLGRWEEVLIAKN